MKGSLNVDNAIRISTTKLSGTKSRTRAESETRRNLVTHIITSNLLHPRSCTSTLSQREPCSRNLPNMPGRRSRSPSPDRSHRRTKRRDEYDDEDDKRGKEKKTVDSLREVGVKEISEDDYL
jgi:hypothetical protein